MSSNLEIILTNDILYISFNFLKCFIYFWERARDRAWVGEGYRERETQNRKLAPGSEQSAQSPTRGSNSRTARSWPEPKSDAQQTEPPRRPMIYCIWVLADEKREARSRPKSCCQAGHLLYVQELLGSKLWSRHVISQWPAGLTAGLHDCVGSNHRVALLDEFLSPTQIK